MVWTVPITFVSDDALTASQLNIFLRDNFLETEVAKATVAHRFIVTSGTNSVAETQWVRDYVAATISVTAQFPSLEDNEDQQSYGPSVTVEHQGTLLCLYSCRMKVVSGNVNANYAPALDDNRPERSMYAMRSDRTTFIRGGSFTIFETEPGISTVTMCYGVSSSEGSAEAEFAQRRLAVLPL